MKADVKKPPDVTRRDEKAGGSLTPIILQPVSVNPTNLTHLTVICAEHQDASKREAAMMDSLQPFLFPDCCSCSRCCAPKPQGHHPIQSKLALYKNLLNQTK